MSRVKQRRPAAYQFAVALLRPLLQVLTKRDWGGVDHLPRTGGFVAVANHTSHIDPLIVAHFLNDQGYVPHFLGKIEVFKVPFVGMILRNAQQIPVFRETGQAADAYRAAVRAVDEGQCVVIYPEGTLTREPDLWPMKGKTGAARIALQTRCPVIPIAQWGSQVLLGPYMKRPKIFPRTTMQVQAGPPVDLSQFYGQPMTRDVLEAATEQIMIGMTTLLEQLRQDTAPPTRFDPRAHGLTRTGKPRAIKETP